MTKLEISQLKHKIKEIANLKDYLNFKYYGLNLTTEIKKHLETNSKIAKELKLTNETKYNKIMKIKFLKHLKIKKKKKKGKKERKNI